MASFYVASAFDNKPQVSLVIKELQTMGHIIAHDWTVFEVAYTHHAAKHADGDLKGVERCTHFVGLFDAPLAPLNTYVELGIAIAHRKVIYIVGSFDNLCIFSRLHFITRFKTIGEFLLAAKELPV